ncbi:MAG: N-acetylmuramoyl-L-alanine amidase [Pseudomonadota bacterium]|nr:N-acetylmuramoyl-L-alanine amidase [Pseudomonadota bacterium]
MPRNNAIQYPSPNHGARRNGLTPELIVIHYTAMKSVKAALDRLCSPEHEVSCHYLIGRDGTLWQMVDEDRRAWHAGAGDWGGRGDVNSRSIGIELDNTGRHPFPEPQMAVLIALLADIRARWSIPAHGVIGHSDFAPSRKADPGRRFDWRRLALEGHAIWPDQAEKEGAPTDEGFLTAAASFGYPVDEGLDAVLDAMRQRFRPWAQGPLDGTDMAIAQTLARRFPVDRTASTA